LHLAIAQFNSAALCNCNLQAGEGRVHHWLRAGQAADRRRTRADQKQQQSQQTHSMTGLPGQTLTQLAPRGYARLRGKNKSIGRDWQLCSVDDQLGKRKTNVRDS
jgi:hypothetical protein